MEAEVYTRKKCSSCITNIVIKIKIQDKSVLILNTKPGERNTTASNILILKQNCCSMYTKKTEKAYILQIFTIICSL